MIGVKGTLTEATLIKDRAKEKLDEMGLQLSESKTKITNVNSQKATFLGTEIMRAQQYTYSRTSHNNYLRRNSRKLRLLAPMNRIERKLTEANFIREGLPHPKFVWMSLEHRQILHLYNSVLRGYLNYYNFAHNYGRVASRVEHILKSSCAKLLAAKFKLGTTKKAYEKFGNRLQTKLEIQKAKGKTETRVYELFKPSYAITLKFLTNPSPIVKALYGSISLARLDGLTCANCGSEHKVEMHHVRMMKDLNPKLSPIDKLMVRRRRKQIPLCRSCHLEHHKLLTALNKKRRS